MQISGVSHQSTHMFIGKEALQKLLRQTRVNYSNGYYTFFSKQGGYEQALRDFQSIGPKLLNDNRHKVGFNIGINHGFQCSNIRWITRKAFEHKAAGRVFKRLPSDPANV